MNRIAVVALIALGLSAASAARAGTDRQKFDSLVGKYASENPFNSAPPRFKP